MNTITTVLIALIIIVALLLVLIIMVQNPKGGGISATFGGGGASTGGVQSTNTFLDKSTWTLAAVMVGLVILTNFTIPNKNRVRDVESNLQNTTEGAVTETTNEEAPATPLGTAPATENKEEKSE